MTTQLEISYLLNKHSSEDQFDSDLPVLIPIEGQIKLREENDMEDIASGANAIMGVQIQEGSQQTFRFVRRSQVTGLVFPQISEENANFSKLRFRILTSVEDQGQETKFAITYEIDNDDSRVVGENTPLGANWLALVTLANEQFKLFYKKESGGPGSGDPCGELGCSSTDDWAVKIKCILSGCPL